MPPQQPATPSPPTILVVEDDPDTREFFIDLLAFAGYRVLPAASGREGLARIAEMPVDAVLLDVRLPDIDGYTICRRIRDSNQGSVPILIVTANRNPDHEAMAREAGATGFLTKPFLPDALTDRLSALVRR